MSEAEKRRRSDYKKKRARRILLQGIIIAFVTVFVLTMALTYYRVDQTYYIDYTENGKIDYRVELKPNEFYDEAWLEDGQAYVGSLVEAVAAEFAYELNMDAADVDFTYTYSVDAILEIIDGSSNEALFFPEYELLPEKTVAANSNSPVSIKEKVCVDYDKYNDLASRFITTYDLSDTVSTLVIRMDLSISSRCSGVEQSSENRHYMTVRVPLVSRTVDIETTSSFVNGETRVLACSSGVNRNAFKVLAVVFTVVDELLIALLVAYTLMTRNHDINYSIKVKRLLSNYRSYIQKITNEFDSAGYQIVCVGSFNEMLSIRDTIQSPILMSENEDCTSTRFLIPTATKILYVFEIRVDDYDEIYGTSSAPQA